MAMEWMATITGDHVGYPGFWDLGDFSPRRKILGSKKSHVFQCQIFAVESLPTVLLFTSKFSILLHLLLKSNKLIIEYYILITLHFSF